MNFNIIYHFSLLGEGLVHLFIYQTSQNVISSQYQDLRSNAIYGAKIIIFKILILYIVPLRKSYIKRI
jgi:hypothetical protein